MNEISTLCDFFKSAKYLNKKSFKNVFKKIKKGFSSPRK